MAKNEMDSSSERWAHAVSFSILSYVIEPWKTVDLKKKTKGRPVSFINTPFPQLYPNDRMVNKKKVDDLMVLLQFVPPIYHDFYKKLQSGDAASESESED